MGEKNSVLSRSALRENLYRLSKESCVAGLKTGTEIEDMGIDEILCLKEICGSLPLTVKIGGPEARRDMRECLQAGVDTILAPMVETEYALSNFVAAFTEIAGKASKAKLAMNLETATAVQNLDIMIRSSAFQKLHQVTIGRGDLSSSMNMEVDDPEVIAVTAAAIRKIEHAGKRTSVGGGWKTTSIEKVLPRLSCDTINTRHVTLVNSPAFQKNPVKYLSRALEFEVDLYAMMAVEFAERKDFYLTRRHVLIERMGPRIFSRNASA